MACFNHVKSPTSLNIRVSRTPPALESVSYLWQLREDIPTTTSVPSPLSVGVGVISCTATLSWNGWRQFNGAVIKPFKTS